MNTKNNKQYQETAERIDAAFVSLLRDKELTKITATEIRETAEFDRSTFSAHYKNIDAMANAISEKIENKFKELPHTEGVYDKIKATHRAPKS